MVDPTQLELSILNLAINARDAMLVGGTLTVQTANVTLGQPVRPEEPPAGDYVGVCVSDTGTGMATISVQRFSSRSSPPKRSARAPAWDSARCWVSPSNRAAACG